VKKLQLLYIASVAYRMMCSLNTCINATLYQTFFSVDTDALFIKPFMCKKTKRWVE